MEKINRIVSHIPLFSGLDGPQQRAVLQIAVDRRFHKGELIFTEGEDASGFYVVVQGRVKIYKLSADGKEQILHIFGAGEPFGEVPVFSGSAFPANADALSDCRLAFFPREAFAGLIAANPSLAMNMLAVLSMRLREFTVQIENLTLKEVPGRLAAYLLILVEEQDAPADRVTLAISKGQLASLLGTIPETLSRIFARMAGYGLIEVQGRKIRLLDMEGLRILAAAGKLPDS